MATDVVKDTPTDMEYYSKRFDLMLIPAAVITLYHGFFLWVVYHYNVIENLQYHWGVPLSLQGVALFISLACGYSGTTRKNERVRLYSLVACTILFILTVSLPIFFWGGSNQSCFSPLLATISSVAVLVTKSTRIRYILAGTCIVLFGIFSITYKAITLNTGTIFSISSLGQIQITGVGVYALLQTASGMACMIVTLVLSRKSTVTIFE